MTALKQGISGIHGAGEALRGTVNQAVDTAFNDKSGEVKNQAVANKGLNEMSDGQYRGDTVIKGEKLSGLTTAGSGTTTSAGAGYNTQSSGSAGEFKSFFGYTTTSSSHHTGTGSSNYGPHSSNLANKVDPRIDSDLDGRANVTGGATTHQTGAPVIHSELPRGTGYGQASMR
ncbi:MAG: hypothetical protein M1827_005759 [Pycnora praestabilis]|nr:MAG: hypothetical protein M1827_005759 [Pycnora praestabilis]